MSMRARCYYSKHCSYRHYGGQGIYICERWHVFSNFIADMGKRPAFTTIDRIDNEKGYEPENCRWAGSKLQRQNQRR